MIDGGATLNKLASFIIFCLQFQSQPSGERIEGRPWCGKNLVPEQDSCSQEEA